MEQHDLVKPVQSELEALLRALLDTLIPPSRDGRFPGAGELGCGPTVLAACARMPGLVELVQQGLYEVDRQSQVAYGKHFAELDALAREQLLSRSEQGFLFPLVIQVYIAYYQHPRVLAALGLDPRPPHPGGYQLSEE